MATVEPGHEFGGGGKIWGFLPWKKPDRLGIGYGPKDRTRIRPNGFPGKQPSCCGAEGDL